MPEISHEAFADMFDRIGTPSTEAARFAVPDPRKIPLLGRLLPDPDKAPKPDKPGEDEEESEDVVPSA